MTRTTYTKSAGWPLVIQQPFFEFMAIARASLLTFLHFSKSKIFSKLLNSKLLQIFFF